MSESEQMYLITIARLCEEIGDCTAPLSRLAEKLGVLPVSVNQMVKKLEEAGLVEYVPYHGVSLTATGQQIAQRVLRCRRMWQVFLVERLGYSVEEADTLSCRLEHVVPDETVERLASFLGNPFAAPDGRPIPSTEQKKLQPMGFFLPAIQVGQRVVVKEIRSETSARNFLAGEGILAGTELELLAVAEGGAILVRSAPGKMVNLSTELAATIWVIPLAKQQV
ncbi:MAG: metal-dependent transcriptional regulator [Anaerolineae bacterium]|nr:metal-dependent transcriptional regulator [Anaerolineae bacterium]